MYLLALSLLLFYISPFYDEYQFSAGFNAVALPNREGNYKLRGLPDGTYTVTFEGIAPYIAQTKTNVVVKKGETTQLETVTLLK